MDAVRGVSEVHGRFKSVLQLDDTHIHWVAEIRGQRREWTTEIIDQQPDEKISWKTIDGEVKNEGIVTFEKVGDDGHASTSRWTSRASRRPRMSQAISSASSRRRCAATSSGSSS